jgi:TolB-like protein
MTEASRAVFLSYASQDAEAARRICEALRAAGIEVWLDQSELRGGDAWDAAIRRQIKTCGLFIPVISTNTHAREEGYFRLEWKLAVDRSHLMAGTKPFLLPVVIDGTRDDERTPEKFREVQWTILPAGNTPPAFVERVARLLSRDQSIEPAPASPSTGATSGIAALSRKQGAQGTRASRRIQPALWLIAAAAVIGVGYLAVEKFIPSKRGTDAGQTSTTAQSRIPAQAAIPEKSIAVLPFVDMSEKKDQEYFSDGLAEELLDLLAQVPDLRVPARTSSFSFKGKSDDIPTIARKLRVAHVLEGSVRKSGRTLRVTVQLIRADNGYHVWSKTYDRDIKDIFKVQDEIAAAVLVQLKAQLLPTGWLGNADRTDNLEAYNLYLMSRAERLHQASARWPAVIAPLRKAIALDPRFVGAYSDLSTALVQQYSQTGDRASYDEALVVAEKAVSLGPDSASAYAARGFARYWLHYDWAGGEADIDKALAIYPAHWFALADRADLLSVYGRLTKAIAAWRQVVDVDPRNAFGWLNLGYALTAARQYVAAREAYGRALEVTPNGEYALDSIADLDLLEGNAQAALDGYRRPRTSGDPFVSASVAMAQHSLGHARESQAALDDAIRTLGAGAPYVVAAAYAWRGENDPAFEWLERAYRQHDVRVRGLKVDPMLEKIRADPRYKALLRKMNLPE